MTENIETGKDITVDGEGFLLNPENWDDDIARGLAKREGIGELTDEMM
jgi:tRNA 2-thiouridine synthesizing protein E